MPAETLLHRIGNGVFLLAESEVRMKLHVIEKQREKTTGSGLHF